MGGLTSCLCRMKLSSMQASSSIDVTHLPGKLCTMLRRHLLTSTSVLLASGLMKLRGALAGRRLGLVIHSYSHRWHGKHSSIKHQAFHDVLDVMDHGRELGIGSLQIGVEGWSLDLAQKRLC